MKYKFLGKTGVKVSTLCLGTMTFGFQSYSRPSPDQELVTKIFARVLDGGVNFIDTSNSYSFGESEEMVGRALKDLAVDRDQVVIATKGGRPMSQEAWEGTGDHNHLGLSRKNLIAACDASLKRLGLDHIDLYQIHFWDEKTELDEILRTLDDLTRSGKIRYGGCSNWPIRHLTEGICRSQFRGWSPMVSHQVYYSLVARDVEYELLDLAREKGLATLVWSPLAGGFLTGKYRRDEEEPEGGRRNRHQFPPVDVEGGWPVVEALVEMAEDKGCTPAQLALAWLVQKEEVTSVIFGVKNLEQLEDNLGATEVELTEEEWNRLEELSRPEPIYPQWMVDRQNRRR